MPAPSATPDRSTCQIRGLTAFAPGYHKEQLFTPADTDRMVAAFARLRGHLTPHAKLGHDTQQRLKLSLGFPSLGDVTAVRADAAGRPVLDLDNVPLEISQAINAGILRSVSIEVVPEVPDPSDASQKIPGPVLTAVSFLGEEQPAVKGLPPIPKATFRDGTEVPPASSSAPWLTAMADVLRHSAGFSEAYHPTVVIAGQTLEANILSFSEWTPAETPAVTPDQIVAAFLALPPDQQAVVLPQLAASGAGPTPVTVPPESKMADPPPAIPGAAGAMMAAEPDGDEKAKAFAAACAKKFADDPETGKMFTEMYAEHAAMKKRFGDMEAAVQAKDKEGEEAKMSAFSAEYDAVFDRLDGKKKLTPQEAKAFREKDLELAGTKAFSTADSRKGIIEGMSARLRDLKIDPRISIPSNANPNSAASPLSPSQVAELNLTPMGQRVVRQLQPAK